MLRQSGTAVYSTIHPGVLPFVGEWAESIERQSDTDFDLCLAIDDLHSEEYAGSLPAGHRPRLFTSGPGATPASVRSEALAVLAGEYDNVILVDADDILLDTRVEAAKRDLEFYDVSVCALRLVDESGKDLNREFGVTDSGADAWPDTVLPRWNIVGGSNSAYRTSILKLILPVPRQCAIVDWYLSTAAWARDARFVLDRSPRMAYRLHSRNMTSIRPPFTAEHVRVATVQVLEHYLLLLSQPGLIQGDKRLAILAAQVTAIRFSDTVLRSSELLETYVAALNELPPPRMWWTVVAHPELEVLWRQ